MATTNKCEWTRQISDTLSFHHDWGSKSNGNARTIFGQFCVTSETQERLDPEMFQLHALPVNEPLDYVRIAQFMISDDGQSLTYWVVDTKEVDTIIEHDYQRASLLSQAQRSCDSEGELCLRPTTIHDDELVRAAFESLFGLTYVEIDAARLKPTPTELASI